MFAACRRIAILLLFALAPATAARASVAVSDHHNAVQLAVLEGRLDTVWVLVAATLVMMMQIGFMLLEAGSVRTKNAISVAQKNLLDFAFATVAFAILGFGIAFGTATWLLPIGSDPDMFLLRGLDSGHASFFIFQVMFCGTAATIISGAVAERMRLRAYIVISVVMSALIYPIFTHWAWGAALGPNSGAILANLGFVDFAGSTVVHGTGGWFALAACLILGARRGRFSDGPPMRMGGHSAVLASAGALFLFVGWIGFNGGSTLAASDAVPPIIVNTVIAGSAGGVVGYGLMWFRGAMLPERAVNGMVGGLVAITAGCHLVEPAGALLLGTLGALAANGANHLLETRFKIDDAVGAVGAHGVAGVVGTLGVALLAPEHLLPAGSRIDQLGVQLFGSVLNFAWAFGVGVVIMLALRATLGIRVTAEEEDVGLNVAEHGARLGTDHIQAALEAMVHSETAMPRRISVEAGDENAHLTSTLNELMDKLQHAETERTNRAEAERGNRDAEHLAAFGEIASESIFLIHGGVIHSGNGAAAALFGAGIDTLLGKPPEALVREDMRGQMRGWLESGIDAVNQAVVVAAEGREVPVELRFRQMEMNGHDVVVLRMTDLTEREEARKRIYHLALHDTLTDLPNRELFNQRLNEALANRREDALTALLIIDLDRFKDVNDLHGHPSGDLLLSAVAERLIANVRECDTVARLGGDEFAVIYSNISFPNQALDLAYRILQSLSEPLTLPTGTTIHPRASIGVAIAPVDAEDAQALFSNADMALYSAKNRGRNGYARFNPEMGRTMRLRQELEEDLAFAIERDQLDLLYQPRINLATGEVSSYEALIRWRRGEEELVKPGDFISIAEDSGLIVPIGSWVIEEACRAIARDLGGKAVSVNISVRQFQDPTLLETIARALAANRLHPALLELEITETVLIDDDKLAHRMLESLHSLGVRVALDDFGTGYSSLSYLTRFRFDTIKIDKSFIQAEDERTWHVIRSVLAMAKGLGISVVAEGVETRSQLERLQREGCNEIQGYFVAHPLPAREAMSKLSGTNIQLRRERAA